MSRDSKPSEIELKRDDFTTDKQAFCAEKLQEHWDSNCEFKELAEEMYPDGPSDSLYRKVYEEYFGVPGDRRTIEELKAQFGSMSDYLTERKNGNVDLQYSEPTVDESDIEQIRKEAYQRGFEDGFESGYDKGHDTGYEKGRKRGREEKADELAEITGLGD